MVQFVQLPQSARGRLSDALGASIGEGLGAFTGNYFANKKLEETLNDPAMKDASQAERMGRLQSALNPYGGFGQKAFQNRMQVEQQMYQEKETKKQESLQKKKSPILSKALQGQELSPEEQELFTPEEQFSIAKHNQLRQQQENKINDARNQKIAPLESALDTVNEMREIRKKGNLGRGSSIIGFSGGETARDRGKYEQLGKSLIQYATNIPIRNKLEFETLAERLYDASITDAEAEGVLDAMESIIQKSLKGVEGSERSSSEKRASNKSERPGFVKMKDPNGVERWIPEDVAKKMQG